MHGVIFGGGLYESPYTLFVHETGHTFGLPDVYPGRPNYPPENPSRHFLRAGSWDVMSSAGNATGFFGWHRHKMGWLDTHRKTYFESGTHEIVLTRLSSCCGTSMAVIPVGMAENPSKVFVVELAEPVIKFTNSDLIRASIFEMSENDGVLIYSVDATKPTKADPFIVYSKALESVQQAPFTTGSSFAEIQRFNKWASQMMEMAPYTTGDIFSNEEAPMNVEVLEKIGSGPNSSYKVKITVNEPTAANQ